MYHTRKERCEDMFEIKDPYILLSKINTKLRDECDSLEELCKSYNLDEAIIKEKMKIIGYAYQKQHNQFI